MPPRRIARVWVVAAIGIGVSMVLSGGALSTRPGAPTFGANAPTPSLAPSSPSTPASTAGSALSGGGAPSSANPFAAVPWGNLRETSAPLASATVLTYQQAEARATAAAAGYDGYDWSATFGVGVAQPFSLTAILSNESFGDCPIQSASTLPSPFEITGTPSGSLVGTSAFDEFYLSTPSNPNLELFVVVDNGTAYLFYTVTPYWYSVDGGSSANSCGFFEPTTSAVSGPSIDSPAAVSVADGLGGSSYETSHPGTTVVWEALPDEEEGVPCGFLHTECSTWVVQYSTAGSCGFFGVGGVGTDFVAEVDGSTGAGLYAGTGQCTSEYPITFTETGLPSGTTWSVQLSSGDSNSSDTNSLGLPATNGSVTYSVVGIAGYATSPSEGTLDVDGAGVNVSISFTPATTYLVTFNETGVAAGVGWSAELNGALLSTEGAAISFVVVAGTYSYEVGGAFTVYANTPSSGTVTVTDANVFVPVSFSPLPTYLVTVNETGLPAGTEWGAGFESEFVDTSNFTTSTTFSLLLDNGTYSFGGASVLPGYTAAASGGSLTVAGAPAEVTLTFTAQSTYAVSFTEEGLPSGTPWAVSFYGLLRVNSSDAAVLGFVAPNSTTGFYVGPVAGYNATPPYGTVVVDGAAVNETIVFSLNVSEPLYATTFTESGLPGGTSWSVTVGASTASSTGTSISFQLTDGSFAFSVGSVLGYTASPAADDLQVDGSPVTEAISFSPVSTTTYAVTFDEIGLLTGTSWSVNLNGTVHDSTTSIVSFSEPNGSYSYSIGPADGYLPTPASGPVNVDGRTVSTSVTFAPAPAAHYAVTFLESGLTSGTAWAVTFGGVENRSTNSSLGFSVVNGSYEFLVGAVPGYTVAPLNGTLVVNGSPDLRPIAFTPLPPGEYSVVFMEAGLPVGTRWSVTLNGTGNSSATSSIGFVEKNGSYAFTVAAVSGYTGTPASGHANVTAQSVTITVVFSPTSSSSSSSPKFLGLPATEGYALLGAILLVIVAAIVAAVVRGRRRSGSSPPSPPPGTGPSPPPGGS